MEHVVFFPGPDGMPAFRRFATQDEAVRFVEHLRNAEGVSEVSMHALTPVPVAFRAYYRAEVPPADAPPTEAPPPEWEAAPVVPAPIAGPVAEPAVAEVLPVAPASEDLPFVEPEHVDALIASAEPSSNGKRSMGLFTH